MGFYFYGSIAAAIIVSFICGYLLGIDVRKSKYEKKSLGVIRVDRSDPDDGPYLFLELCTTPAEITENEYVIFKVNNENYISQK